MNKEEQKAKEKELKEKIKDIKVYQVMQYSCYEAEIHYDAEDEIYYGSVIHGLCEYDSVNFHAPNFEELKANFIKAIDNYNDTLYHPIKKEIIHND